MAELHVCTVRMGGQRGPLLFLPIWTLANGHFPGTAKVISECCWCCCKDYGNWVVNHLWVLRNENCGVLVGSHKHDKQLLGCQKILRHVRVLIQAKEGGGGVLCGVQRHEHFFYGGGGRGTRLMLWLSFSVGTASGKKDLHVLKSVRKVQRRDTAQLRWNLQPGLKLPSVMCQVYVQKREGLGQ